MRSALEWGGALVLELYRVLERGGPGGVSCLGKSEVTKTVEPFGDRRTMGGAWLWETYLHRAVRSSCEHKWPRARWGTPPHSSPGTGCRHAPGEPCRVSCLETLARVWSPAHYIQLVPFWVHGDASPSF